MLRYSSRTVGRESIGTQVLAFLLKCRQVSVRFAFVADCWTPKHQDILTHDNFRALKAPEPLCWRQVANVGGLTVAAAEIVFWKGTADSKDNDMRSCKVRRRPSTAPRLLRRTSEVEPAGDLLLSPTTTSNLLRSVAMTGLLDRGENQCLAFCRT